MKNTLTATLLISIALLFSGCLSPAEKHARAGDTFFEQHNWDNAIAEYTTAQDLDTSIDVSYMLARAYANRGTEYHQSANYDAAISDFQNALKQDTPVAVGEIIAESYKARAIQYIQNGEYDKAIADATTVLRNNSADAVAYYIHGTALIGKGAWDLAIVELSKAVGIDAAIDTDLKLSQAYLERAKLLLTQNNQNEAAKYIEQSIVLSNKAISRDSTTTAAYRRLANAYNLIGEYDAAMSYLSKAIELDPNDSVAYTLVAEINLKMGDSNAALSNLDEAITLNPNNATAYYQRAIIYLDKGKTDLVIDNLSKAIELNPHYYMYFNRAQVYRMKASQVADVEKTRLLKLAIDDWTKSIELEPNLFLSYFWRGRSYFDMQQWALAEADLEKAIELSDDPEKTRTAENLLKQIASKQKL